MHGARAVRTRAPVRFVLKFNFSVMAVRCIVVVLRRSAVERVEATLVGPGESNASFAAPAEDQDQEGLPALCTSQGSAPPATCGSVPRAVKVTPMRTGGAQQQ